MAAIRNIQLVNDMMRHMTYRLGKIIVDIADTCERADVGSENTVKLMMSCMMVEVIKGAACLNLTEAEFIRMCRTSYRDLIARAEQELGDD